MPLDEAVRFFVGEAHSLACLSVACGNGDRTFRAMGGVINAQGDPVAEDSIFDLASITKLFTGMLVLRLWDSGHLDLDAPVTAYAPQFVHLSDTRVDQILGFERALKTEHRVDGCTSREEGLRELFAIQAVPNTGRRAYSDMHAMVLKYILEGAAGESYLHILHREILDPLGMEMTFGYVPEALRGKCVSCDREHRIEKEKWILRAGVPSGIPHDPKARLLNTETDCCGHAGLFATIGDLERFCRGVLGGKVLSDRALRAMAKNRTGRQLEDGSYIQYLGCQCYVRHPQQVHSEVPVYMSDRSIAISGFTGHHLSMDPEKGIFMIALGNRVLNRLSVLVPEEGKTLTDYGLHADGTGQIRWTDGEEIWSSVDYVHLKDEHLHAPAARAMGLEV